MVFIFTRGPSEMRSASVMPGLCLPLKQSAIVAILSLPHMPWFAPREASQLSVNEIRDITAFLLTTVCYNVATEPHLQPLSGKHMRLRCTITTDEARLDNRARGFWSAARDAYFDVRVFHPNASSNSSGSLPSVYKRHEDTKKPAYGQRIREVEQGVFTPLVFSTTGGMGREATTLYKRLGNMLASHHNKTYSMIMRCKLSFAPIRSSLMCIRGTRSSNNRPLTGYDNIALATT